MWWRWRTAAIAATTPTGTLCPGLEGRGISLEGGEVLLFGAGGAGRGIALSLLEAGVKKLYICNLYEYEARGVMEMLEAAVMTVRSTFPLNRRRSGLSVVTFA